VAIERLRGRGQTTIFAGVWLALFVPFFQVGALGQSYSSAAQAAFSHQNDAPLLLWATQHLGLVIVFPLIEVLPLALALGLPALLRDIVLGGKGRVTQWMGLVGLGLFVAVTLVDLVVLFALAEQFAHAGSAAQQISLGTTYRDIAVAESLIADVVGGVLIALWLGSVSVPLARLPGFERAVGIIGIIGAAIFAATAVLAAYAPTDSHRAFVGTALGWFGLWLALLGYLIVQRAPLLVEPPAEKQPNATE
jgi:hypothetical protein